MNKIPYITVLDFYELNNRILQTGLQLLETKSYENTSELLTEVLTKIAGPVKLDKKAKLSVIYGNVHKEGTLMDIGEDQFIPIFAEEENDDEN